MKLEIRMRSEWRGVLFGALGASCCLGLRPVIAATALAPSGVAAPAMGAPATPALAVRTPAVPLLAVHECRLQPPLRLASPAAPCGRPPSPGKPLPPAR